MAKCGMKLDEIEKLLAQKTNVTVYEYKNEIDCKGVELLLDEHDVKFYAIKKSDKTSTLTIVFRTGVNSDHWLMWRPTKNQALVLENKFPNIYHLIDNDNKKNGLMSEENMRAFGIIK